MYKYKYIHTYIYYIWTTISSKQIGMEMFKNMLCKYFMYLYTDLNRLALAESYELCFYREM